MHVVAIATYCIYSVEDTPWVILMAAGMTSNIVVQLSCCSASKAVPVNEMAILQGEHHESRKTVKCPSCKKIVIVDFHTVMLTTVVGQEVIDVNSA